MSERALYAVRSEGGQWLSYGGWEDGLVCGAAYDNLADATEDAADHGGEVVALVPLTAAQERDLQAMAALAAVVEWFRVRDNVEAGREGYEDLSVADYTANLSDALPAHAEAILAAAAKLEEAKAKA